MPNLTANDPLVGAHRQHGSSERHQWIVEAPILIRFDRTGHHTWGLHMWTKLVGPTMIVLTGIFVAFAQSAPELSRRGEMVNTAQSEVVADLVPTGKLRAAINFGNTVLAQNDPVTGQAQGVSVDLARELGRRLDVPVELIAFDAAAKVFDAL